MKDNRHTPRGRALAAVNDGFVQGVLVFGMLLAAEWIALGSELRSTLGSPLPTVISLYLLSGGVLGSAVGLFAWIAARMVSLRPARISFVALAYVAAALFILRNTPAHTLAAFPLQLWLVLGLGVVAAIAAVWWARRAQAHSGHGSLRFAAVAVAMVACSACVAWGALKFHHMTQRHAVYHDVPNAPLVLVDPGRRGRP